MEDRNDELRKNLENAIFNHLKDVYSDKKFNIPNIKTLIEDKIQMAIYEMKDPITSETKIELFRLKNGKAQCLNLTKEIEKDDLNSIYLGNFYIKREEVTNDIVFGFREYLKGEGFWMGIYDKDFVLMNEDSVGFTIGDILRRSKY